MKQLLTIIICTTPWFFTDQVFTQIAIRGDVIHTMAGEAIEDGVILIRDDKIEAVGSAVTLAIPDGYTVYSGQVVTPGLIDAHATVGLTGIYNQPHDQDQLDRTAPMQPDLRAMDGYNPMEELVGFVRNLGTTTVHVVPGPGALIGGQTLVAKTLGTTIDDVMVANAPMLSLTLGPSVSRLFNSPGTRSKSMAMLRSELAKAQEYMKKSAEEDASKRPARDLRMEALAALLKGESKALITAHRATEIMSAIRLSAEFGFPLVLDGAAEAYLLLDEIREAGAEVVLHAPMARSSGDLKHATMESAAILYRAGIPFAIQSGFESYVPKTRIILYEAAIAVRYGLPFEEGLRAITASAAKIIGQDHRIGSIETGKDADLVIFDGDPFEYRTKVCTVFVNGVVVHEVCEQR